MMKNALVNVKKESAMVPLMMGIAMMGILAISTGCSSVTNGTSGSSDSSVQITRLSYSVSPSKSAYSAGETVAITVTTIGPEDVGASWSYSLKGGSLINPTITSKNFVVKTSGSGFKMVVSATPQRTKQENGVDLISGDFPDFTIQVP